MPPTNYASPQPRSHNGAKRSARIRRTQNGATGGWAMTDQTFRLCIDTPIKRVARLERLTDADVKLRNAVKPRTAAQGDSDVKSKRANSCKIAEANTNGMKRGLIESNVGPAADIPDIVEKHSTETIGELRAQFQCGNEE